jgi:hypothetical protein
VYILSFGLLRWARLLPGPAAPQLLVGFHNFRTKLFARRPGDDPLLWLSSLMLGYLLVVFALAFAFVDLIVSLVLYSVARAAEEAGLVNLLRAGSFGLVFGFRCICS